MRSDFTIDVLIDEYYSAMLRLAQSYLDDRAEAEDATQEIFIAAHKNLKRFRGDSSVKTWLYTIGTNLCRRRLRQRKRREVIWGRWERDQTEKHTPSLEHQAVRSESDAALWAAVDELKPKHREPIILRYVHDLTAREIGEVLGISEGTVYSRIHYAQKQLRGVLIDREMLNVRP